MSKSVYDLWCLLSALLESTCATTETLKPILEQIKDTFASDTEIGKKVRLILIAEPDFDFIELDNLRYMLHEVWEKA